MVEAVETEIRRRTSEYIILDYPFGRTHPAFRDLIDLSVFIDTPLDVAMARRILRDYKPEEGHAQAEALDRLRQELTHYLEKTRYPYLDAEKHKESSDLVLEGWSALDDLRDEIIERVRAERDGRI